MRLGGCLEKSLTALTSFSSLLLRLLRSDTLTDLLRIVQHHGRALARHSRNEIIAAAGLYKLTGGVVAPAMNIVVQSAYALPDVPDSR